MRWTTKDIDMYLQAKEYVDTALLPLVPVSWTKDIKTTVAMGEFMNILTLEIERQFKGRMVLFPSFTYLNSEALDDRKERLTQWEQELKGNGFHHIFYITADRSWNDDENKPEPLLWFPSLSIEHVDEAYKQSIIQDQIKEVLPHILNQWKAQ